MLNPASIALCKWMEEITSARSHSRMPEWAEEWANELTAEIDNGPGRKNILPSDDDTSQQPQLGLLEEASPCQNERDKSRTPRRGLPGLFSSDVVRSEPWCRPSPEMITNPQDIVSALHQWGNLLKQVPYSQKENLTVTFEPAIPIRSEAQLHSRVAAMGIPIFSKTSSPKTCPFGLQGGLDSRVLLSHSAGTQQ